jgi:hypothetical protein
MSKIASPLLGYNNNVRHKNRVFHIQTEDSGVKHPHIITHLFMDGGRILKSIKRSYAEHVGADKMQDTVKQMMKEQHKAMFIALRDGQFDGMLEDGGAKDAKDKEPKEAKEGKEAKAAKEKEAKEPSPAAPVVASVASVGASSAPANAASGSPAAAKSASPAAAQNGASDDVEMVPQTTRMPEMALDIGAIERSGAPPLRQLSDLPPPPPNMFRDKTAASGAYRTSTPSTETAGKRASGAPPKPPSSPPKKPASQPAAARNKNPASEGRYAAARPAAIFGQARPQQGSSIFGEDLISDKSLDEVILSYLAEDLEPTGEKKK